jgi:hypothetical protein
MKLAFVAMAAGIGFAAAACPNDCSGHGVCGSAQCECYRNWMGADCSDRVCTFGRAFIDSPTGDLNGDGAHDPHRAFDPTENVEVHGISNVVGGRSELFDHRYGYARSSRTEDWDEAHFYRECSNKGVCDRSSGQCDCFPGYWGEGCDRTVCPNDCSGHGVCRTLSDSYDDEEYTAWDLHKTAKCVCDAGFTGPACSMRECPRGADPVENAQVVTDSIQGIYWNSYFDSGAATQTDALEFLQDKPSTVYYTLTFTDEFDDEWVTQLLTVDYVSSCTSGTCYSAPNATIADIEGYAEAVNNSLAALPMGAVNGHYVWTTGHELDTTNGNTTGTGAYYPNSGYSGESVYVDSLDFRLDLQVVPDHCYGGVADRATNHVSGMCTFVKMGNPGKQNALQVKGWYTPSGDIDGVEYMFESVNIAATAFASDHNAVSNSTATILEDGPLVVVDDVQSDRTWNPADGDVIFAFTDDNIRELDVCSKRGVCDYSTGLCKCFSGYSGVRCDTQNSISFSF